jgi:hypothetical protein
MIHEEATGEKDRFLSIHAPQPMIAAIDAYAVKLSARLSKGVVPVRVSRAAAARALIQVGLERADDPRKR